MYSFNVHYTYDTIKQVCSALLILCVLVPSLRDFVNPEGWANIIFLGVVLAFLNFLEGRVNKLANSLLSEEEKREHEKIKEELAKMLKK